MVPDILDTGHYTAVTSLRARREGRVIITVENDGGILAEYFQAAELLIHKSTEAGEERGAGAGGGKGTNASRVVVVRLLTSKTLKKISTPSSPRRNLRMLYCMHPAPRRPLRESTFNYLPLQGSNNAPNVE